MIGLAKPNVKVEGDVILLSTKRCAAFFGVTSKTLLEWKQTGCPQSGRGWWNPEEVYRWRCGLETERASSEGSGSYQAMKLKAEAEYRAAKAAQEEIRLAVLKEEYIPFGQVEEAWSDRLTVCRTNMFGWVHNLPSLLEGMSRVEIQKTLEDEVQALWEGYSRDGPFTPEPDSDSKEEE
nr:hypothetical protein [uncultured Dethiosulfovibrio sp.]